MVCGSVRELVNGATPAAAAADPTSERVASEVLYRGETSDATSLKTEARPTLGASGWDP